MYIDIFGNNWLSYCHVYVYKGRFYNVKLFYCRVCENTCISMKHVYCIIVMYMNIHDHV